MERIFSGYIKAHGYAIAVTALTFGCIFAADVLQVDDLRQTRSLDGNGVFLDRPSSGTYFRMRPLGQLIFSLVWILAGFIFLVGMLFEKKETIFPFASIFAIDWSVILVQHLTKLERRSFNEVVLSVDTAVLAVIPLYVGFTLAVLYKLFESRPSEPDENACGDIESSHKPVKFTLGDDGEDSWIS